MCSWGAQPAGLRRICDESGRAESTVEAQQLIHDMRWRAGITPDPAVDAYMKASALSGDKHSVTAEYILRLLALEECADVRSTYSSFCFNVTLFRCRIHVEQRTSVE